MKATLGDQIRIARKAKGWTQDEFATKVGQSRTTVLNWESNKFLPKLESLKDLERLFKTRFYVSGGPDDWEDSPDAKKEWKIPGFVSPDAVEMAVLLSRLPNDMYRAIRQLITMAGSRDDMLPSDGLEIINEEDRSNGTKPRSPKPPPSISGNDD